jgi:hypothetical protein
VKMKYLFDEEIQETEPVGIGYWICVCAVLIACLALGVFALITTIKLTWFIWGW